MLTDNQRLVIAKLSTYSGVMIVIKKLNTYSWSWCFSWLLFKYFCISMSYFRTKDLRNIFEEMDVNQNGVVTLKEFKRVLKK